MSTRPAPYRHADGSNCWTKDCRLGSKPPIAYKTWLLATPAEEAVATPQQARLDTMLLTLVRPNNLNIDFDAIEKEIGWVRDWEQPWTPAETTNLALVERIAAITERKPFTPKDEEQAQGLQGKLHPIATRPYKRGHLGGFDGSDTDWRSRDRMLHALANDLLLRAQAENLPVVEAEPVDNPHLLGLKDAQEAALKRYNHPTWTKPGRAYLGHIEPHYQSAIARVSAGEELAAPVHGAESVSLLPDAERAMAILHPDSRHSFAPQMYLAAVFPVRELRAEMERAGIDGVSVSFFENGREWGNAYTVVTPDGSTRTFSVYEHRNTDSIIINGTQGWDGQDLPYAGESKQAFFAEFEPDDKTRAAQALTFYLMAAQRGELEDSAALAAKVSRRDWNAILDESIPGFKQWRQSSVEDRYIAPKDENEADILKRLDF